MKKMNMILAAVAIGLPAVMMMSPANAAATHNLQNGTNTSNASNSSMSAPMMQRRMAPMMMHRRMKMRRHHMMKHGM